MDELLWCRLQMSVVTHVWSRWIQSPVMTVPTSPPLQSYANILIMQSLFRIRNRWQTIIQRVELANLADILLMEELATWTDSIRLLKICLKWERQKIPGQEIEGFLWNRKQSPPPHPPPPFPTPTPHRHDGYTITKSLVKQKLILSHFITSRQNSQYNPIWWWKHKSHIFLASAMKHCSTR